jgi:hypothetical protein
MDYGLIAEEVAEVYPDLVAKNKDGQIETVQYHKLTPMMLNELQKLYKSEQRMELTIQKQQEQIRTETELNRSLQSRLAALEELLLGRQR